MGWCSCYRCINTLSPPIPEWDGQTICHESTVYVVFFTVPGLELSHPWIIYNEFTMAHFTGCETCAGQPLSLILSFGDFVVLKVLCC